LVNAKQQKRSHCLECHNTIIEKETDSQKLSTIKAYGVKPNYFLGDIDALTLKNPFYRQVVFTSQHLQIVLQRLQVSEDIDMEKHKSMEQTIHVVKGHGRVVFDFSQSEQLIKKDLYAGYVVTIPRNEYHRIENASQTEPLLFYTMYTESDHPADLIQKDKYDLPAEGYIVLHGEDKKLRVDKFASINDLKLLYVMRVHFWRINTNTNKVYELLLKSNVFDSTGLANEQTDNITKFLSQLKLK
jgi:mannose-6-phosphate isomerase-like protein (cupin superfamily)